MPAPVPTLELERERPAERLHRVVARVNLAVVDARSAFRDAERLPAVSSKARAGRVTVARRYLRVVYGSGALEAAREVVHVVAKRRTRVAAIVGLNFPEKSANSRANNERRRPRGRARNRRARGRPSRRSRSCRTPCRCTALRSWAARSTPLARTRARWRRSRWRTGETAVGSGALRRAGRRARDRSCRSRKTRSPPRTPGAPSSRTAQLSSGALDRERAAPVGGRERRRFAAARDPARAALPSSGRAAAACRINSEPCEYPGSTGAEVERQLPGDHAVGCVRAGRRARTIGAARRKIGADRVRHARFGDRQEARRHALVHAQVAPAALVDAQRIQRSARRPCELEPRPAESSIKSARARAAEMVSSLWSSSCFADAQDDAVSGIRRTRRPSVTSTSPLL